MEKRERTTEKPSFSVCTVVEADIPQIAELERICFSDPWSEQVLRDSLENALYRFVAVKDGARVLGYAGMFLTVPEAQIANIAVTPDARRKGLGRLLLRGLVSEAEQASAEVVFLEVREHNAGAIALYEQEGFVRVGMRKNYYENPVENGYIYVRETACETDRGTAQR
ncbi:MAG: ribosomal protein S18-alanine N-acetyltransferase [Lachnospiraceae bacterium]|nr:ribosomal protein S18-alanine N-acetyltransferase [Lachnospiraceae bacterium]